jgi:hypothetical protein
MESFFLVNPYLRYDVEDVRPSGHKYTAGCGEKVLAHLPVPIPDGIHRIKRALWTRKTGTGSFSNVMPAFLESTAPLSRKIDMILYDY